MRLRADAPNAYILPRVPNINKTKKCSLWRELASECGLLVVLVGGPLWAAGAFDAQAAGPLDWCETGVTPLLKQNANAVQKSKILLLLLLHKVAPEAGLILVQVFHHILHQVSRSADGLAYVRAIHHARETIIIHLLLINQLLQPSRLYEILLWVPFMPPCLLEIICFFCFICRNEPIGVLHVGGMSVLRVLRLQLHGISNDMPCAAHHAGFGPVRFVHSVLEALAVTEALEAVDPVFFIEVFSLGEGDAGAILCLLTCEPARAKEPLLQQTPRVSANLDVQSRPAIKRTGNCGGSVLLTF